MHPPGKSGYGTSSLIPAELWEASRASKVVAVSAGTGQFIKGIDLVIPNSVDNKVFCPGSNLKHQHRHNHPAILFVGTLSGRKRGQMLLDLFQNQIRPALPKAELWMVAERKIQAPGVVCFMNCRRESLGRSISPCLGNLLLAQHL